MDNDSGVMGVVGCMWTAVIVAVVVGGWFQHLYTCFTEGHWGFLIAGAIFFPIAIIHGWGIWLSIHFGSGELSSAGGQSLVQLCGTDIDMAG